MNVAYLVAGALAVLGAAIHGGAGEALVVRRLDPNALPRTCWGGGEATLLLIRGTWHMLTLTFAVLGASLAVCGVSGDDGACDGVGTLAATTLSGFAAMAVLGALARRNPRALIRHPAPVLLTIAAVLTWVGGRT